MAHCDFLEAAHGRDAPSQCQPWQPEGIDSTTLWGRQGVGLAEDFLDNGRGRVRHLELSKRLSVRGTVLHQLI